MRESGFCGKKSTSKLRGPWHINVMDLSSWPSEVPIAASLRRSAASAPAFVCEAPGPSLSDNAFLRTRPPHAYGKSPLSNTHTASPGTPSQPRRPANLAAASPRVRLPAAQAHRPASRNVVAAPSTGPREHGHVTTNQLTSGSAQLPSSSSSEVAGNAGASKHMRLPAAYSWPPATTCHRSARTAKSVRWLDHVAQQAAAEVGATLSASLGSNSPSAALPMALRSHPETRFPLRQDSPYPGAPATPDSPLWITRVSAGSQPPAAAVTGTLAPVCGTSPPAATAAPQLASTEVATSIFVPSQRLGLTDTGLIQHGSNAPFDVGHGGDQSVPTSDAAEAKAVNPMSPRSSAPMTEAGSRRRKPPTPLQLPSFEAEPLQGISEPISQESDQEEHGHPQQQPVVAPLLSSSPSEHPEPLSVQAILQAPLQQSQVPLEHFLSPSMLYALEHAQPVSAVHRIPRRTEMEPSVVVCRARSDDAAARHFSIQEFPIAAALTDHADGEGETDNNRDSAEKADDDDDDKERRHMLSRSRVWENKRAGWKDVSAAWREEEADTCTARGVAGSEGNNASTPCGTGCSSPHSATASGYSSSCSSSSSGAGSTRSISVLSLRGGGTKRSGTAASNGISSGHNVHDHTAYQQLTGGFYRAPSFRDHLPSPTSSSRAKTAAGCGHKHLTHDDVDQEEDVSDIINIFCRREGSNLEVGSAPPCAASASSTHPYVTATSARRCGSFSVKELQPHTAQAAPSSFSALGTCTWGPSSPLPGDSSLEAICRRGSADNARFKRVSASSHSAVGVGTGTGAACVCSGVASGCRQGHIEEMGGAAVKLVASGPVGWTTRLLSCFVSREADGAADC